MKLTEDRTRQTGVNPASAHLKWLMANHAYWSRSQVIGKKARKSLAWWTFKSSGSQNVICLDSAVHTRLLFFSEN